MSKKTKPQSQAPAGFSLNEDWLAVILAFALILLAAVGILGKTGIPITF